MFLDRNFEYGGTIGNLDSTTGQYFGVYIIVLPDNFGTVQFVEPSAAYKFRGKDPTVSIDKMKQKWVDEANVLYIGKRETKTVYHRIQEHVAFWNGQRASAWGGRVISQIQNYESLEVWYLRSDNPKDTESILLNEFISHYGKLPFANWRLEEKAIM